MRKKVYVLPDGTIRAVLDKILDSPELGERVIRRESNVEFDEGVWKACLPETGQVIAVGSTREVTLQKEHSYVEYRLNREIREAANGSST